MYQKKRRTTTAFVVIILSGLLIGTVGFLNKGEIMNYSFSLQKGITKLRATSQENEQLKAVATATAIQNIKLIQLEFENKQLNKAVNAKKNLPQTYSYSIARIINQETPDTIQIDLGSLDGITKDLPVISLDQYFVGIVTKTTKHTATIQLINTREFLMSKGITVTARGKNLFGIFEYDISGNQSYINRIPSNAPLKVNDIIETAGGDASKYPKGLKIGRVTQIESGVVGLTKQATVDIQPFPGNSELFVFVVRDPSLD